MFDILTLKFHEIDFPIENVFTVGSPIGLFLSLRQYSEDKLQQIFENLDQNGQIRIVNCFHPFDPIAYRLEPLIDSSMNNVLPVKVN